MRSIAKSIQLLNFQKIRTKFPEYSFLDAKLLDKISDSLNFNKKFRNNRHAVNSYNLQETER